MVDLLKREKPTVSLSSDDLKEMYRRLTLIRRFEETAFEKAQAGKYANYHGGMGQEAIPVGVTYNLTPKDSTMITHRGLGVLIARGVSLKQIYGGLYAIGDSPTRGRIPIYNMSDPSLGILAGTSMVGSGIPLATGAALADKLDGNKNVVISFFGDGATNRGDFHEGINLAAVWNLPIVFFCENNYYAKSMPIEKSTAGGSIIKRANGYGLPSALVDGNDVIAVHKATNEAIERARSGGGPTFIECETYRWKPHSTASNREFARTPEELAMWQAKCPIMRLEKDILNQGHFTKEQLLEIDVFSQQEVSEAIEYVETAKLPTLEVAFESVYL